jgi:hypothetical protein
LSKAASPAKPVLLETLGRIATDHDEAVAPLTSALTDKDVNVRVAAAKGLMTSGPRARSAAAALLREPMDDVRRFAVRGLVELHAGDERVLVALARDAVEHPTGATAQASRNSTSA